MIHLATRRMALCIVAMAATAALVSGCGYKDSLYLPPPGNETSSRTRAGSPPPAAAPASMSEIPDDTPASSAESPLN